MKEAYYHVIPKVSSKILYIHKDISSYLYFPAKCNQILKFPFLQYKNVAAFSKYPHHSTVLGGVIYHTRSWGNIQHRMLIDSGTGRGIIFTHDSNHGCNLASFKTGQYCISTSINLADRQYVWANFKHFSYDSHILRLFRAININLAYHLITSQPLYHVPYSRHPVNYFTERILYMPLGATTTHITSSSRSSILQIDGLSYAVHCLSLVNNKNSQENLVWLRTQSAPFTLETLQTALGFRYYSILNQHADFADFWSYN